MILHPTVIANVLGSTVACGMVVYANYYGVQILKSWNLQSGEELQLSLERRTYLISTLLSYVFALQLLSLFLFVFTADALTPLFVGAMCAAGTLNVNGFGYPTLILKIFNFIFAGLWLVLNHADNLGYDYPLIKKKYLLLACITPFIGLETILEAAYFLGMRADVITSCCGSLFSSEKASGLGSDLAALPARPMLWTFYIAMAVTLMAGIYVYVKQQAGYLYSMLSAAMFFVAIAAIISCISLYIYELPTHNCPFCLIMKEYGYIGYLLYVLLFGGVVFGLGLGVLLPFRNLESLRTLLPALVRRLAFLSVASYGLFTVIVTSEILSSNLIM